MRVRVQVSHAIDYDQIPNFIYVEKIMSRMSNNISMMENMNQIRASRCVMSMDEIKSQVRRCRVCKDMNKVESMFKWHIMTAEHVEKYFAWERRHVQAKRQRQPWGE